MSLPEYIREARLQAGLSQEQVAEALEVSRQAVSRWERGASRPSTATLVALATLFHRSVEQLTGRYASSPQVEEG
ncbi:helix-turn-helix transcriptional regulator, partial [Bittarella massiliensis (ex Durand et al. 2017)]